MKEGEPVLGGPQVSPGNVQPTNPGVQPVGFETLQNTQTAQATPLVSTPSPTFAPSTPPVGTQLNNPAPLQPAPTSPQIPPQPLRQFSPQSTTSPAAPNMGDIILSDASPQKSKKGLITAIIICLVLLMTAGVAAYFISQNNSNTATSSNADIAALLNRYSNYLLYQTDSDASINNDTIWSNDKILENLNLDGDAKATYFTNLVNLFDGFSEEIKKKYNTQSEAPNLDNQNENPEDNEGALIGNLISNTDYSLKTLKTYSELNRYGVVDMVEIFLSQGGEKLIETVKNSYNDIVSSEYSQIKEYTELEIKIATLVSEVYTEYVEVGCINNNEVAKNCLGNTTFSETHINNKALLDNYVSALDDVNYHITNDVIILSRELYKEMNTAEEK